jgi:hypothetical protein
MKFKRLSKGKYKTVFNNMIAIVENTEERTHYGKVIWDVTITDLYNNTLVVTNTDENDYEISSFKAAKIEAIRILGEKK